MWTNKAKETKKIYRVVDPNNHTVQTKTLNQLYQDHFENEELIEELSVMEPGDDYFDPENQLLYVSIPSFLAEPFKVTEGDDDDFSTI